MYSVYVKYLGFKICKNDFVVRENINLVCLFPMKIQPADATGKHSIIKLSQPVITKNKFVILGSIKSGGGNERGG